MAVGKAMIFCLLIATVFICTADAIGGKLGGMMEIEDVEHNKEVQDLGKFSVSEYNNKLADKNKMLEFVKVVSAEKQVVSGDKYYMKIEAKDQGEQKFYNSQVVVKPWLKTAPRTMLKFGPAKDY